MTPPVRFDAAWLAARRLARDTAAETGWRVVLVRDVLGRVSLLLDDRNITPPDEEKLTALAHALRQVTHPFAGVEPVQTSSGLFAAESLMDAPDLAEPDVLQPASGTGRVALLERSVVGADWLRTAVPESPAVDRRVALYGYKGGVGRSTAAAVLARHLAGTGRCVLVADLDLESPGVSSLLEEPEQLPDHGVVDHLIEAGVGAADGLDLVTRASALPVRGNGEVWLAPAAGRPREGYDYLAKLNRIYSDLPEFEVDGTARPFPLRLEAALTACEDRVAELSRRPDIVLLDSRAGVHDVAAVTVTQLSGLALLFAVDNPATWNGYRMLFSQWREHPQRARQLRERLRVVAAMQPQTAREERVRIFQDHAQQVFSVIYDDEEGGDLQAFNPSLEDEDAPHAPIPILFSSDLIGLDPVRDRNWIDLPLIDGAYREFLGRVERLLPEPFTEPPL